MFAPIIVVHRGMSPPFLRHPINKVTSTTAPQRDAMARAILCLLAEDWDGLIDAYRLIGIVPDQPCRWVRMSHFSTVCVRKMKK
jgi:hypothetical protein